MTYLISLFAHNDWSVLIYCINMVIALTIIFLERKNPSASLAWILVLFVLPVLGIFLYFMLSQNISRYKISKLTDREKKFVGQGLSEQIADMDTCKFSFANEEAGKWHHLIKLNQVYGSAFLTQNNDVILFTDGK